jgi:hypothetical protein
MEFEVLKLLWTRVMCVLKQDWVHYFMSHGKGYGTHVRSELGD